MMFKGIDELLAAGRKPRRLSGGQVELYFVRLRHELAGPPGEIEPAAPVPQPDAEPQHAPVPATTPMKVDVDGERPPFPVDVFPEKVANFARRVAAAMGCPVDFPGIAILVVSGAAVGAARSLQVKGGWHEKPGVYAVIVSRPGTTKTPALKAVMQPLYDEQDLLYQSHQAALVKYKKDVTDYKQAARDREEGESLPEEPAPPPPLKHVFAADTTVEALAGNLETNRKGILLFRDELTAWVRSLDMYRGKGADRQFYLSVWSGEMVKVDRKSRHGEPVVIPHPFVSVLGGIQPDLLTELEAEGGREDGFLHRILFGFPPEQEIKGWIADEITEEDEMDWQLVLRRLLNLQPVRPEGGSDRPRRLEFSPEGQRAFADWCDRLAGEMNHEDFPRELTGPCSKLRAYCARFCLIVHLLRVACDEAGGGKDEGRVDADDVGRAARLCAYFRAHFGLVYPRLRQTRDDQKVDELVAWLKRKGRKSCTPRDVQRANVGGIKTASEAEKLLRAAADRGLGELIGGGERGRRKESPSFALRAAASAPPDRPDTASISSASP